MPISRAHSAGFLPLLVLAIAPLGCGPAENEGAAGPAGDTGATGPAGPTGPSGDEGPQGPAGTNGTNGTDGAPGVNGGDGAAGAWALVSSADEPAGANCANGGAVISSGSDANQNDVLDEAEIESVSYVCDGAPGAAGGGSGDWTLLGDGRQQASTGVVIEPADPGTLPSLMVLGGQWSPAIGSGRGDVHIGNDSVGLSFGVSLAGGGTGVSRIWTKGGVEKLFIGSDTDPDMLAISGDRIGVGNTNPTTTLHVSGDARVEALGHTDAANRRLSTTQDGTLTAGAFRMHSVPKVALRLESVVYTAPLQLPDGAVLDRMDVWYVDNTTGSVSVELCVEDLASGACTVSETFTSTGASAGVRVAQVTFAAHAMDNGAQAGSLVVGAILSGGSPTALSTNLDIRAINFRYRE